MQDPAAGVRRHAVTAEHGLGDNPAIAAGGNWMDPFVERQYFKRSYRQPAGVEWVWTNRPAKESPIPIREQVAGPIEANHAMIARQGQVGQFPPRLEIDKRNAIFA